MSTRLTMLPEGNWLLQRPALLARLAATAREITGEAFADVFDKSMRGLLVDGFHRVGAHEGTVWLLDETREALVPRFNSGPNAGEFVGVYRQSLRMGMISMVVAMEQPICENEVARNAQRDPTLDQHLRVQTCAMLAVPFCFLGRIARRDLVRAAQNC